MNEEPCRAELAIRGRRGLLSQSGGLAFAAHLADCTSCRLDQQIFAELDEESVVEIRDGARIERLAAAGRDWAKGQQGGAGKAIPVARSPRVWAAAVALVLLAGTAGATTWWMGRPAGGTDHGVAPAIVPSPGHAVRLPVARRPEVTEPAAVIPPSETPRSLEREAPLLRLAKATTGSSASSLLRQAGDARREGDVERAMALYRRLQGDFAGSPEALLSKVPLGNLLLGRGRTRAALAQFDRYLVSTSSGVLVPEALYGRARALAALGDRPEEQRAWRRLLREFPASAYAPLARRRIAESR